MSGEINWGPEIAVEKGASFPEWLRVGEPMQYQTSASSDFFDMKWGWGWGCVGGNIRLPADHPHYAAQQSRISPNAAGLSYQRLTEDMQKQIGRNQYSRDILGRVHDSQTMRQATETGTTAPSGGEVGAEVVERMREALKAEIERQCAIGAGEFAIDDGYAQSGLWRINADLDPVALVRAAALLPEPVDADRAAAIDLLDSFGDALPDAVSLATAAIKRGRSLEKGEAA